MSPDLHSKRLEHGELNRAYFNLLTGVASATPVVQIAIPVIMACHPSGRPPHAETYYLQ